MSIDGKYQVTITTPGGKINGTLTLAEKEMVLSGSLVTGDFRSDFTHGSVMGSRLTWVMKVKTPYVLYDVDCTAKVDGSSIKGEIRTKTSGFFGLEGNKSN